MNKKTIITILLACVTMTALGIDEYQFHSGPAVLKGRILNKPEDKWNIVSVIAYDLFMDKELIYTIPVAPDGRGLHHDRHQHDAQQDWTWRQRR